MIQKEIVNKKGELETLHIEYEKTADFILKSDLMSAPSLLEPILQRTGLACLAGSSDTGKSLLLRQLAIAISAGESEFIGFPINSRHNSVIYVATEDNIQDTAKLLSNQASKYPPEQLKSLRFIFDSENLYEKLEQSLTTKPADMVVIDCMLDCFNGDFKDTTQIRRYLRGYQKLAEKYDCLILYLHHTGKRTEEFTPSKNNLLSGQGFEAKMRLVIEMRSDPSNLNVKHLCIVKGNFLSSAYKTHSYMIEFNNESLTYSNTGVRVPFELLTKNNNVTNDIENFRKAQKLVAEGKKYEDVAKEMGFSSKGTITKLLKKGHENKWNSSDDNMSEVIVEISEDEKIFDE